MVLLSSDLLYGSGLPTRGPADRPCSSNAGCSSWHSLNHNYFRSRLGRQGVSGQVVYRSSSSSTSITIAPAKSISNAAAMAMTDEQASGQAPRAKVLVSYYEETDASTVDNTSPQQQRTGTGVLKINMDLMLVRNSMKSLPLWLQLGFLVFRSKRVSCFHPH